MTSRQAAQNISGAQNGGSSQPHPPVGQRFSLAVPTLDVDRRSSISSERSIGVVAPSSNSLSQLNGDAGGNDTNRVHLLPGQVSLLTKITKPFNKTSYEELKRRIAERERADREINEKMELGEAKLVDGHLVMEQPTERYENDPKLAEGKNLPKIIANHFPKQKLGTPVEDIDPKYRIYDETFLVISRRFNRAGYIFRFSASPALFIFQPWNPIRKLAIYTYTHPLFDLIIVLTILANSLFMAMNVDEKVPEYTFLAIYTLEAIVKTIARGMILTKFTYLRDPWNWLDFIVILSAYAFILADAISSGANVNLQALRTFRVFRVLKTIAIIPGLKTIIEALLSAFRNLTDVLIMTLLFFTIFALFGVQMFSGLLQTKCVLNADVAGVRLVPDSTPNGTTWSDWVHMSENWAFQDDGWQYMVCGNYSMAQACPESYTCILVTGSENPNLDFTRYDDFMGAFFASIQLFNTDYWDYLYHAVVAANGPSAILFFISGLLFLNYYLANLVQAVVVLSYQVEEDDEDEDDANEIIAAAKRSGKRFVFDPSRLRIVRLGPGVRTRSLQSVRSVSERRVAQLDSSRNDNEPESSNQNGQTGTPGKPVAVVRPQVGNPSTSSANANEYNQNQNQNKPVRRWPGYENAVNYRIKSRPPSAVAEDDWPKIGYWDRNPHCCFRCCICFFSWLRIQHGLMLLVTDPFFDLFITLSIVVNTISMASRYDGMDEDVEAALDQVDNTCTYIFIAEATLKLTAMCGEYFSNRWNWLDLIVVIGSLVDIALSNLNSASIGFNTNIIRLLRLLRILKLAQSWKTMRTLLEVIFGTLGAIANLMLVLLIVMFIFAVIGMQLFSGTYTIEKFTPPTGTPNFTPFPGFEGVPEWNWSDFLHSFMMVFRVLCRETYQPMFDCSIANSFAICIPIYMITLFIGSYVVLNLFLAVLLNAFSADELKQKTVDEEDNRLKQRFRVVRRWLKAKWQVFKVKCCCCCYGSVEPVSSPSGENAESEVSSRNSNDSDDEQPATATIKSGQTTSSLDISKVQDCCSPCFERHFPNFIAKYYSPGSPNGARFLRARLACLRVTEHKAFEYTILVFIFASSITLCLQDATLKDDDDLAIVLSYLDYVFLGVFTIEMILKLFSLGAKCYFTSFWTLLDFVIVVTGYVDVILSQVGSADFLSALRALRTLRALRPLRAISRWEGMRIVINALITAIPGIINVLLVVMIIWLIFAIMGVQFFAGKFYMCVDVESGDRLPKALVPDKATCLSNPYKWQWANFLINFDNVFYAYLALFQVATFEGWTTVIQCAIDAPENKNEQPYPESNVFYYLFFFFFIVLCSFFLLNLFVGVIIDDFNTLKKKYEGARILDLFMTDQQKNYYSTIKKLGLKKPRRSVSRPSNKFLLFFYETSVSTKFEFAIAAVIVANAVVMATEHFDQANEFTLIQESINFSFTVVFTLEAVVKLIGLGIHYFRSAWNVFDFTIVIVSLLSVSLSEVFASIGVTPSMLRVLRVLRVGRVVRVVRTSKGIRKLMYSLMMSLPALFNIGCLLFLVVFIYAIIGMNLFGHVGHTGGNIDDVANFQTFPVALLTLFRLSSVAGWDNVHQGLSFSDNPSSGCNPNVTITDPFYGADNPCCNRTSWKRPNGEIVVEENGQGNCGSFTLATLYVISYIFFTYFIIVNMFAAVILDFYQDATNQDIIGVTDEDIERFYMVWEQYDPMATQFIKLDELSSLVAAVGSPLGFKKPNDSAITLMDFLILRDSQTGDEVVHCVDVLMGLVRKALGFIDETEDFKLVRNQLESVFKSTFPSRMQAQKISSTKWRKKQEVAAKTIQRRWRKWQGIREIRTPQARNRRAPRQIPLQENVAGRTSEAKKLPFKQKDS